MFEPVAVSRLPGGHPRRSFLKLTAAAAVLLGTGWSAARTRTVAAAGEAEALLLNCIDFRLIKYVNAYMDGLGLTGKYDQVILAGGSLGAQNDSFPEWAVTFWQTLDLSIQLHGIHRVIVIDHRDCGAYKLAFNVDFVQVPEEETLVHTAELTALRSAIQTKHPDLKVDLGLMALDGTVQPIGLQPAPSPAGAFALATTGRLT